MFIQFLPTIVSLSCRRFMFERLGTKNRRSELSNTFAFYNCYICRRLKEKWNEIDEFPFLFLYFYISVVHVRAASLRVMFVCYILLLWWIIKNSYWKHNTIINTWATNLGTNNQ